MGTELVEIVGVSGGTVGVLPRDEARVAGMRYRVALTVVFDELGRLVAHRRTDDAPSMPGFWDVAAGGAVDVGEDPADAAVREVFEELGVAVVALEDLGAVRCDVPAATFVHRFVAVVKGELTPDAGEVSAVVSLDRDGFERLLLSCSVCPDSKSLFADEIRRRLI
jgi:8-oxo-dGTP pyrophosphatase MutT (NUDIX family)